jgi:hypothetical protein
MIRKIAAVVFGAISAIVLIIIVERLSHAIYPPPADFDVNDKEALRSYMDVVPVGALLSVCAAWMIGAFGGGMLATFIARESAVTNCAIVGGLVLVFTIINLFSIPHPMWFAIVSVVAIILATYGTGRLAGRFVQGNSADTAETISG